jgi:hypothetical protein
VGSGGLILGALAVNGASAAGTLVIARRRGSAALLLCTLVACLVLMRTSGPEALGDAWNLRITVLPFLLMAYLTWSMFSGEWWALPAGTAVASSLSRWSAVPLDDAVRYEREQAALVSSFEAGELGEGEFGDRLTALMEVRTGGGDAMSFDVAVFVAPPPLRGTPGIP